MPPSRTRRGCTLVRCEEHLDNRHPSVGTGMQSDLYRPLVDYAAKGTKVELEGTEKVEDRDTSEADLRSVGVLKVPYVLETVVQGVAQKEKSLDESLFAKPQ